jgi:putative ABC transport system permease protein
MSYALAGLWHERNRYLPAVVAVAFSALLIVMQVGLLLGIFSEVAVPIDQSRADLWVGYPGVRTVDITLTVPAAWEARLAGRPEVERVETYLRGVGFVGNRGGGVEIVTVLGVRLDADAIGPIPVLTPDLRARLAEPNTVVVDEAELADLGLRAVGDHTDINDQRVRLVGTVRWMKGIAGAYVFCSTATARALLGIPNDRATYLLARCRNPADAPAVARHLRSSYGDMAAFTREEFSLRSRVQWLTKSRAGISLLFAALLGLMVGTGVTSQTLYAATAASAQPYAMLAALGVPRGRLRRAVLTKAFYVGLGGTALAGPAVVGCVWVVQATGGRVVLPAWVLAGAAALTLAMALLSGLLALRSLRLAEPALLLR